MKSIVLIPTYNERENITKIIKEVLGQDKNLHLLIIDDSSPDGTFEIVRHLMRKNKRLHLLLRAKKEGLGRAYLNGFDWALGRGYQKVITMDADFSHPPRYIPRLLKAADFADVVIGSRYVRGGKIVGWPLKRHLISRFANLIVRMLLGLKPKDSSGGFKCYDRKFLRKLPRHFESRGYSYGAETLLYAQMQNLKITEVPITFYERRLGKSKIGKEMLGSIGPLWRLMWQAGGIAQFIKFCVVGASSAIIDVGILNLLVIFAHFNVYLSGTISFVFATINGYTWNRLWTFKTARRWRDYIKFLIIQTINLGIHLLIMYIMIDGFHIWYNTAKATAIVIGTIWTFSASRKWVFETQIDAEKNADQRRKPASAD